MAETHNLPSSPAVPHWHAGYNQPGYLPEAEPGVYTSYHAARDALAEDMEAAAEATETWADPHDCDDIPCPTYGEDCPWQAAGAIRAERDDLIASDGPEWSGHAGGLAHWVTACGDAACVVDLVAQIAAEHAADDSALAVFAATGAIEPGAAAEADRLCRSANSSEQVDLDLLCACITASGVRGAVPNWAPQ
jgi:hypothetical protein